MRLALYEPDIPQNTGTLMRLAACFDVPVDIIEPCGFIFDDKRMRRAGMDYLDMVNVTRHDSWDKFFDAHRGRIADDERTSILCGFRISRRRHLVAGA